MRTSSLVFLFLVYATTAKSQCIIGLDPFYCAGGANDTLTAEHPGGYFDGTAVSGTGILVTALLDTGTYIISYNNTNYYDVDTTGTFAPIAGTGTNVNLPDDGFSDGISIGFNFEFFGYIKSLVRIHSNGFISFNFDPAIFPPYANDIPTPGMPTDFIAAAWGDYDPTAGGTINYFSTGAAPFRKLVINFINLPPYDGTGNLTAQIVLNETTNIIEIHTTASPDYGNEKSQGIENVDGTLGFVRPGRNNSIWSATEDYVAFIPQYCYDTIHVLESPEVAVTEDTITVCTGSTATLHVSGASSYFTTGAFTDMISGGATPDVLTVEGCCIDPGTYTCYISGVNAAGCADSDAFVLELKACTDVNEIIDESYIHVFPNPAEQYISISVHTSIRSALKIEVFNMEGELVRFLDATENTFLVDIADLSPGIYSVLVDSGTARYSTRFARL